MTHAWGAFDTSRAPFACLRTDCWVRYPAMSTAKNLQTIAYTLLGGSFLLSAIANHKSRGPAQINGLGDAPALPENVRRRPRTQNYDVTNINDRVALIAKLIRQGALNSDIREKTVEILSSSCTADGRVVPNGQGSKWCVGEKDCLAEAKAIFDVIRNPRSKFAVRYTRDSLIADVFTAAERTLLKTHGGDCDDYCVTIGAMLMSVGHPVRLRVIQTSDKDTWSHIYLITPSKFDDPTAPWVALDASMDRPFGWEAPGAREVARTGKPHGIVTKVKDFSVVAPSEIA